jgi:uncharacterized protein
MNYLMRFPSVNKTLLLLWLCAMLFTLRLSAQNIPAPMSPPRLVNDFAGVLGAEQVSALEQKLLAYNDSTSSEVTVVTLSTIDGDDVTRFAIQLGEEWGVGKKGRDNGVVVLVVVDDRLAAIATGYGMEGAITDADTYTIRERYMNPAFRQGNFYKGLDDATTVIFRLASGEWSSENLRPSSTGKEVSPLLVLAILVAFILLIVFSIVASVRSFKKNHLSGKGNLDLWAILILMNEMNKRNHGKGRHGGFGGFSGGRGSFGGGGGFGGFGGGSFGGGGSGGGW